MLMQQTKKITVDQTYENATKIKGKTKKGCVVKVKIGKKTYQSKVNKKGNYSVKVSKLKLGKKYTMTAYQKKKVYAEKEFLCRNKEYQSKAFTENDHIFSGYAPIKAYIVLKAAENHIRQQPAYQDIGKLIRKSRLEEIVLK